ncbi:uncharacterized protein LOC124533064 [Vanessa cardui]|uniref:uncharacterized protein LOC124533064 n=1 Tax=Vanessa cardui TaxID=171605 RepID=UPI001F13D367|nr:uncharacterized protein LOC124533064 [Vanessa cardui]
MQDEVCKVQGALAVVLRMSRALGLAPLRFAHDRGGYIVTVSRRVAIYGYILSVCSRARHHALDVFVNVFWCVMPLSTAVVFIEPWHQISAEVKAMRILLIKLKLNMTPVGMSIPLELDLMFKQLLLNQPTMSPLGLVTIQRSLLTKTISFLTTYFVIMIQCMQKRWEK